MALTRKALKAMGLTDEQVDSVIEMHTETTDALKAQRDDNKAAADRLAEVEAELETMKNDGYKQKYEDKCKEYDKLVEEAAAEKTRAAKEKAARAYFEGKNIVGANLDLAMRACGAEVAALEMDEDKIKDTAALDALIAGAYKNLVSTQRVKGSNPATPPKGNGEPGLTKADVLKMSYAERAELYEKNPEQFGEIMKG